MIAEQQKNLGSSGTAVGRTGISQCQTAVAALRQIVGLLDGDVDETTVAEARNVAAKVLNGGIVPTRAERAALV